MTFHNAGPAHPEPASPDESPASMKPGAGLTKRRRFLISAGVVLTAVTGVAAAHAATAAVSEPTLEQPDTAATSFDAAFWHLQDQLVDLRGWTEGLPGIKTSGYVTSINNEPVDGSVVLVWHGPPDPVQRQIIDEARRRNIPVSVQQRKHSMADLERAANQIFAIESGTGEFHNFKISGAATFSIDFDGVTVIGQYIHPPAEGIAAADTALTRALTARTGVAVTIEHGELVAHRR
ncbi:hypothetical protein Aca07nite_88470 [Actinoplanes capillaceus]|uniref:Uncharacterized protein n=2 Tax=Actinoplanes campanulatus TaxID=113559 RepID=A0ABQ3WZC7_9ACTN|nr:hypothetical protein Aca07nite_88470 [Actinoplanes capillaceus]